MRIAQRLVERRHDRRATIRRSEDGPPFVGRSGRNELCDGVAGRFWIALVIDKLRRQHNCLGKGIPEFLLNGSAGDELSILRRIDAITRRTADQPQFSWFWETACGRTECQRSPGERKHCVGHRYIDMAALPALIACA